MSRHLYDVILIDSSHVLNDLNVVTGIKYDLKPIIEEIRNKKQEAEMIRRSRMAVQMQEEKLASRARFFD